MRQFIILCLFCSAGSLFAYEGVFVGLCAEVNGNSAHGPGVSGGIVLGIDLHRHWAIGVKTAYNHDLDSVGMLEQQALLQYYFVSNNSGIFSQVQAGYSMLFLSGDNHFMFNGGWGTGWRFKLGNNVFFEPAFLVGYPFFWGASLTAGAVLRQ